MNEAQILEALAERIKHNILASEILFYARVDVERHLSKKNSRPAFVNPKTGYAVLGKSSKVTKAENSYVLQLRSQANAYGLVEPIRYDLHAMLLFHFKDYFLKDKKRPNTRSKFVNDLSNLVELPQDCLQKAGVIENDSQICSLDGSRRLPSDENYCEIFLLRFKDPLIALPGGSLFRSAGTFNDA